jgi:hypothetical protein
MYIIILDIIVLLIIFVGSANNGVFKESEGQPIFDLLGF